MNKLIKSLFALSLAFNLSAQNDVAEARTFGIGQTVTVTAIATNGSELGIIRYIQDGTAGIAAYGNALSGVNLGDSITVTGELSDFAGLLEIAPISNVTNHGQAVIQPTPLQVPIPTVDESFESELIEVQNVNFVETGNFSGNTTYTLTDGSNTLDVRVNNGTNIVGAAIPTGPVTVKGLTGQFNANYQIVPRFLSDISAYVAPDKEINILLDGSTVLTGSDYFFGNTASIAVVIENLGSNDLTVSGSAFNGVHAGDFSSDITSATIAGGSTQSFTISYAPQGTGSRFATLEVTSDDADESTYSINLEGVGTDNLATEPSANPSNLTFPLLKAFTLGGQYTAGTGANSYLVLWKNGSAITSAPVDGTTYLRGDIVGDARVAYVGPGTSFTPRGVIANQDYHFAVYAFNGSDGFENYLTSSPASGIAQSTGENIGSYYNGINTSDATFTSDLGDLINPHTQISYFLYKQTMMNEFEIRDTTNGESFVTCAYTGERKVFSGPFDWTATGYSREHTYAHSWMATWPADSPEEPEYTDQHNLYPTNLSQANSPRSNLAFGEIDGDVVFSYLDGRVGYMGSQLVYEPRDQQKGNVARAIFYMTVAYDFPLAYDQDADKQAQELLKEWHFADLPDNYEIARNEYIAELQGNRNPFVDSVEFACFVDFDENEHIAAGCNLSIEEQLANRLVVFPVPAQETAYVQVNGTTIESIRLIATDGQVVLSEFNAQINVKTIDLSTVESGVYLIQIETPIGQTTGRLIVQ